MMEPGGVTVSWLFLWTVFYLALALPFLWSLCRSTRAGRNAGRVVRGPEGHAAAAEPGGRQAAAGSVLEVDKDGALVYFCPIKGPGAGKGKDADGARRSGVEERRARYAALTQQVLRGMLRERGKRLQSATRKAALIDLLLESDAERGQRCSLAGGGGGGEAGREVA